MEAWVDSKADPVPLCLDARLHGVLANPLRYEIVMRTGARPWCATELSEVAGYSRRHVSKAIKELKSENLIELVEKRPGPNGRIASYYRAVCRFTLHTPEWEQLPVPVQAATTATTINSLYRDMVESLEAGRLHADPLHVLMRDHRRLDQLGRERVVGYFLEAYEKAIAEEAASLERVAESGEALDWSVFGLSSFRRGPERPASP